MHRRDFLGKWLLGTTAFSVLTTHEAKQARGGQSTRTPVTVRAVHDHLRRMGAKWIPLQSKQTVDTIKSGRPDMKVTGIATVWMGTLDAMKKAHAAGCNLLVVHEPIFYNHRDSEPTGFARESARKKKAFLERTGMAVIRCHDVWDRVARIGICDAWARFLGLEKEIDPPPRPDPTLARPYHVAYEVDPIRAGEFASSVAASLGPHAHEHVLFIGPRDKIIRSVAVGTGACTRFNYMATEMKVDLAICSDDGFTFWRDGALAIDMEFPVIIVSHSSSEEPGMQRMAEHLAGVFPQVPVKHIAQTCMYREIGPES